MRPAPAAPAPQTPAAPVPGRLAERFRVTRGNGVGEMLFRAVVEHRKERRA